MTLVERISTNLETLTWLEFLIGATLTAMIVVPLAIAVAEALLRKSSGAARHLVLLLALITTLIGPGLSRFFQGSPFHIEAGFLVTPVQNTAVPSPIDSAPQEPEPRVQLRQAIGRIDAKHLETLFRESAPAEAESAGNVVDGVADRPPTFDFAALPPPSPATADAALTASQVRPWVAVVLVVWGAVAAIASVLVLAAPLLLSVGRRRYAKVTDEPMLQQLRRVADELRVRRRVTLVQSESHSIPMTWGIFHPVLLLPTSAREWTDERLRMVLLHELAHVRRLDCLWQIVSALAVAVHWFNPLVWLAAARLRGECERACDDVVLSAGVSASSYAEQLLDISTGGRRGVLAMCAGLAMARSKDLAGRVRAIIDESRDRRPFSYVSAGAATLAAVICLATVVLFTGVRLEAVEEARDVPPASNEGKNPSRSTKRQSLVPEDMRFVEEGRRRLANIRFAVWDFTFVRLKYTSARPGNMQWATDYPAADRALSQRLDQWTSMNVNREGLVKSLTDDDLGRYPLLYASEPGSMLLSDEEVVALREYLSSGGVLMADDFWGEAEWENVQSQMKRVFPDIAVREVPDNHRMFRWPFRLPEKPQVCSIGVALAGRDAGVTWERNDGREPHYWWLIHDKRVIAICCQNTDLADGWERREDNEWYAREFSEKRAYPMMMNILAFTMANSAARRPGQVQFQYRRDPATGGEQRVHPAVADAPEWLDLKRRLESTGLMYRSVDVDVAKVPAAASSAERQEPSRARVTPAAFISLDLSETSAADLSPLRGAAIDALHLGHTQVADLSPLEGMKLQRLDLSETRVEDLSPLRGMPIERLSISDTVISDLTPLTDARLVILEAASTRVADIRPLAGQPLTYLDLRDTRVAELAPLAETPLTALQLEGAGVVDLLPLSRTPLKSLGIEWRKGMDLRQLTGLPLTRLRLTGRGLSDIAPLASLKLESLELVATDVTDLSPIASLPLREMSLQGTPATDLTPLQAMDLANLYLSDPGVDLAGIQDTPIFFLQLPDPVTVKNFELLRSMKVRSIQAPGTKRISTTEFLRRHDGQAQRRARPPLPDDEAVTLIQHLKSDDKSVREQAARRLESFGPNAIAAVEPLILALNDSEDSVVRAAGDALEAMGTLAAQALVQGMDHEDPFIRHRCGFALSNIRPVAPGLVPRLVQHLSDEHQRVRLYAAISLGNLGPAAGPAVADLLRMLETNDKEIRRFTIEALGKIGPKAKAAVPALIQLVGTHQQADVALGRIGPDAAAAVPMLIQRYQNGFRDNTLWALARIGPPARAAIPMLTEALTSSSPKEREKAQVALAMITGNRQLDTRVLQQAGTIGDQEWGEAVDGVQVRLRLPETLTAAGGIPTLIVDVVNRGSRTLGPISPRQPLHEIELDGVWYRWNAPVRTLAAVSFPPQAKHEGIPFSLDGRLWTSKTDTNARRQASKPLKLTPGTHIARVAIHIDHGRVRAVSNKVEFATRPPDAPLQNQSHEAVD